MVNGYGLGTKFTILKTINTSHTLLLNSIKNIQFNDLSSILPLEAMSSVKINKCVSDIVMDLYTKALTGMFFNVFHSTAAAQRLMVMR